MVMLRKIEYLVSNVKGTIQRLNYYFAKERANITEKNLSTLRVCSVCTLFITVILMLIFPLFMPDWVPTIEYYRFIPTLLAFIIFSFYYSRRAVHNYYIVQTACLLFYVLMIYHIIDLTVFSNPYNPETFLSCFFIMMPVLFIINPFIIISICVIAGIVFSELVVAHKAGVAIAHDTFSVVASLTFSIATMFIIYKLRLNDFALKERYKKQSRTDLLTGLLNKCSYENFCKMAMADKSTNTPCAIFVFDVDSFKQTNDTHGHMMGDRALEIVGNVLSTAFRSGDLVGRIGGDEFSVLMLPAAEEKVLKEKAQYVRQEITKRSKDELGIPITISAGICLRRSGSVSYEQMFAEADKLLYKAKASEKDRVMSAIR